MVCSRGAINAIFELETLVLKVTDTGLDISFVVGLPVIESYRFGQPRIAE